MNETRMLVEAYDALIANGDSCALATIVSVEGSSYRRPGAKMLITRDGATTGTISAGCLESDVIEHAKRVIQNGKAKVVVYDNGSTTDEMAWGLGLGCNGVVRVLIEPLTSDSLYIEALRNSSRMIPDDSSATVITVYACSADRMEVGARFYIGEDGATDATDARMVDEIRAKVDEVTSSADLSLERDGSEVKVFVEKLMPPVPLVIFGAGHDALPIAELARTLGWQTEIVDPQLRDVSRERFSIADRVTLASSEDVAEHVTITPRTMAIVMSHNYSHDLEFLRFLLTTPARYIGVMGPRKRTERMLDELSTSDIRISTEDLERIYSPVGLDIGANGPTEIALSIVAEMRAVVEGRRGGLLRESRGPIQNAHKKDSSPTTKTVGAVILAAGSSSRMGEPKQALKFGDSSLLRRSALAAIDAGCWPVIVVTGANADVSRIELEGLEVQEVFNLQWETGMGSSIAAGVAALAEADPDTTGIVITLCDQPYVSADVISRLVSARELNRYDVIASRYGENVGVPAYFDRSLFDELMRLDEAAGAKTVIVAHSDKAFFVPFPEGAVDVDTPEDYARLITRNNEQSRSPDHVKHSELEGV